MKRTNTGKKREVWGDCGDGARAASEVVGKNWTRIEGFFGGFFIVNNVQNTQKIQLGLQGESGH